MKTIEDGVFWTKVLPNLTSLPAKACGYKRVVPFKSGKGMAIGLYLNELNTHMFFMLADPKEKAESHDLFSGLYYIAPGLKRENLETDVKNKYHVPSTHWQHVATADQLLEWIGKKSQSEKQLALDFPRYDPNNTGEEEITFEKEESAINPSHYKSESGLESIDVINAFFKDSFNLGNAFKYMARKGKKLGQTPESDLKKAVWYIMEELKDHVTKEEMRDYIENELITKHAS